MTGGSGSRARERGAGGPIPYGGGGGGSNTEHGTIYIYILIYCVYKHIYIYMYLHILYMLPPWPAFLKVLQQTGVLHENRVFVPKGRLFNRTCFCPRKGALVFACVSHVSDHAILLTKVFANTALREKASLKPAPTALLLQGSPGFGNPCLDPGRNLKAGCLATL